jgi:hypothetical protein
MKKKFILIIVIAAIILALFLIPSSTYEKIFGKNKDDDQVNVQYPSDYLEVYMLNENDVLVGVKAYVDTIEEDVINQKFDCITNKTGKYKKSYETSINTNTTLIDYSIEDSILCLNVSNEFLESEGRTTLEQLVWSFCDDEICEVDILVDGKDINCLNGFYFDSLTKKMGINLTLESNYVFEVNHTTVIEYIDEEIRPVTYFYKDLNQCDFIVSKLFNDIYNNKEYDYVLNEESLIIDVAANLELTDNQKRSIEETIKYNLGVSNITIQGIESVLLEIISE